MLNWTIVFVFELFQHTLTKHLIRIIINTGKDLALLS